MVELAEREAAQRLLDDTYDERVALKKVELARMASEEHARAGVIDLTQDERRAAEMRVIAARADAQCEVALEFERAENARQSYGVDALVEAYDTYLSSVETFNGGIEVLNFAEFVDAMPTK